MIEAKFLTLDLVSVVNQTSSPIIASPDDKPCETLDGQKISPKGNKRIAFLFNHEQSHQILHSAPILDAMAASFPNQDISVIIVGDDKTAFLVGQLRPDTLRHIKLHPIAPLKSAMLTEKILGSAIPITRVANLIRLRKLLAQHDVVVTPETTSLLLKSLPSTRDLKIVYTQHGAGDRAVGFKASIQKFDCVLVPGRKIERRMLDAKIVQKGTYAVVGYPKFNSPLISEKKSFFTNSNPTVLYNPHFDPSLSSWYDKGLEILEYFYQTPKFNLIFAPHVMLFSRRVHLAPAPFAARRSGRIPQKYLGLDNIRIDLGSFASINMAYARSADIYLGDVSSQIYEFITPPKPSIFVNSGHKNWQRDTNFSHWHLGKVIYSVQELDKYLKDLSWHTLGYLERQKEAFVSTFGEDSQGAAARAAAAIIRFSEEGL